MTEDEMVDGTMEGPFEGAAEGEPSDMEPEALEALRMLDEIVMSVELEMETSPEAEEPEILLSPSKEDQQDRIEYRGKKALEGVREIADYLNPVHEADGTGAKPQPLLALAKVIGLTYREVWTQRGRLAAIEKSLAAQASNLNTLSIDMGFLLDTLRSENPQT